MKNRICPVCESDKKIKIHSLHMEIPEIWKLPKWYDIVNCLNCGFCFADTSASVEDYSYYYSNFNMYNGNPQNADKKEIYIKLASIYSEYARKDEYIIDMGCGDGSFIIEMGKIGFNNICGMDTSQSSIDNLREKGINAVYQSIYDMYVGEKADWLHLGGVLEHLLLPREAILNARKYIKDNGKVTLVVPNIDNLYMADASGNYFFNHEHINYFSLKLLKKIMFQLGFQYVDSDSDFNQNHDMFVIFEKCEMPQTVNFIYDGDDNQKICDFFEKYERDVNEKKEIITDLVLKKTPLIVWGCGAMLFTLLRETDLGKANIVAYVDNNPEKQKNLVICNQRVYSPDIIRANNLEGTILVCNAFGGKSLLEDIKRRELKHDVIVMH